MTKLWFALAFIMGSLTASAHEFQVQPVEMELRIEPAQIRVHISCAADYWIDAILHVGWTEKLPAANWPLGAQKLAKEALDRSFELRMDGVRLSDSTLVCRYTEEPFLATPPKVVFEMVFPVQVLGRDLSGRAQFFQDYYKEVLSHGGPSEEDGVFLTKLRVVGKKKLLIDLPYEKPDFEFEIAPHSLTKRQLWMEKGRLWGFRTVSSIFFWIFMAILGYQIYQRTLGRKQE